MASWISPNTEFVENSGRVLIAPLAAAQRTQSGAAKQYTGASPVTADAIGIGLRFSFCFFYGSFLPSNVLLVFFL